MFLSQAKLTELLGAEQKGSNVALLFSKHFIFY